MNQHLMRIILDHVDNPGVDVLELFSQGIENMIENAEKVIKEREVTVRKLSKMVDKIKSEAEENVVQDMVNNAIRTENTFIHQAKTDIESFKWCIKFMEDYSYDVQHLLEEVNNNKERSWFSDL